MEYYFIEKNLSSSSYSTKKKLSSARYSSFEFQILEVQTFLDIYLRGYRFYDEIEGVPRQFVVTRMFPGHLRYGNRVFPDISVKKIGFQDL